MIVTMGTTISIIMHYRYKVKHYLHYMILQMSLDHITQSMHDFIIIMIIVTTTVTFTQHRTITFTHSMMVHCTTLQTTIHQIAHINHRWGRIRKSLGLNSLRFHGMLLTLRTL